MTSDCIPKILLRSWIELDADALFALAGDPVVGELAGFPPHRDVEDSRRVIREILSKPGTFAVVSSENHDVVGCVSALPFHSQDSAGGGAEREIGYWIGRRYWGHGFATAAVSELCRRCFSDAGVPCACIIGRVKEKNARSRRVLEKCGFRGSASVDGLCRYTLRPSEYALWLSVARKVHHFGT